MDNDAQIEWIGLRHFYLRDGSIEEFALAVSIGKPTRDQSGYWKCVYRIEHRGISRSGHTLGVDELDSMMSALAIVGTSVNGINEAEYEGRLAWEGGDNGNLGLPTADGHHWPWPLNEP
jgi:hypothetical protein